MERFTINACDVKSNRKIGKNRKVIPVRAIPLKFDGNFNGITILSQYAYDEFVKTNTVEFTDVDFSKKAPEGTIAYMIQNENPDDEK